MCPPTSIADEAITDAITELEFELADRTYFFVGLSADGTCRVRLDGLIRTVDDPCIGFFTATGCPVAAIHDRADRTGSIDSVRVLADTETGTAFRVTTAEQSVAETIGGAGGHPHSIVACDGVGQVIAQVPRCVDPEDVIGAMGDHHPASELVARRHPGVSTPLFTTRELEQIVRDRLTARQWEVLVTAYANGYFDSPRAHTGVEVAEMLGISNATFSQHLRSAQRNLLSLLVDERDLSGR